MSNSLLIETESIRQSFREWHAERESLDAQLTESLSALSAFQTHLDSWQQQLAREREELCVAREQCAAEQAALEKTQAEATESTASSAAELNEARNQIAALSASLAECTAELNAHKQDRVASIAELESLRASAAAVRAELDQQQQAHDVERIQWAAELQQVREELKQNIPAVTHEPAAAATPPTRSEPATPAKTSDGFLHESPVLESIVQQFGKLRQQRASDREALRKAR